MMLYTFNYITKQLHNSFIVLLDRSFHLITFEYIFDVFSPSVFHLNDNYSMFSFTGYK